MISKYRTYLYGGAAVLLILAILAVGKSYGDARARLVEAHWKEVLAQERLELAQTYMDEIARQQAVQLEVEISHAERKKETDRQLATLSGDYERLQQFIRREEQRRREGFATTGEFNGAGADWIGGFATCAAEYIELGGDFARTADKLRGLQEFTERILE